MHRSLSSLLTLLCTAVLLGAAGASAQARVGLYPSPTLAEADRAVLEATIDAQQGFDVVAYGTMKDYVVAAESLGVVCADASPDCLARIVAVSGVPYAVYATPGETGGRSLMRLVLVDGSGDSKHRDLDLYVRPSGPERAAGIESGLAHLLTGQALTGAVVLAPAPDDNATVMVDGARVFRSDLERLDAGRRTITVIGQGKRWQADVEVLAGVTTNAALTLVATPPPDQMGDEPEGTSTAARSDAGLPVLPVALMGAGGAVVVVGVLAGAAAASSTLAWVPTPDAYAEQNPPMGMNGNFTPEQRDTYNNTVQLGQIVFGAGVVAMALGVAVGGALVAGGAATWALE